MVKRTIVTKKTVRKKAAVEEENVPVIINLRPGTAAEKALQYTVPGSSVLRDPTVADIVSYGLGLREDDGINREGIRIQDRLRTEMQGERYGVTVNGSAVERLTKLSDLLKEETSPAGVKYRKADIIVASRQEGAYTH